MNFYDFLEKRKERFSSGAGAFGTSIGGTAAPKEEPKAEQKEEHPTLF